MAQQQPPIPSPTFQSGDRKQQTKKREYDWAMPEEARYSTAIERPVVVECREDRLLIASDNTTTPPREVPFTGTTDEAVDPFVAAIWDQTKTWGYAGRGFYWRPTVSMQVSPGGEKRFQELKAQMANSGIVLTERTTPVVAAAPPPAKKKPPKKSIFGWFYK